MPIADEPIADAAQGGEEEEEDEHEDEEAEAEFEDEDEDEDSRLGGGGSRVWHLGHLGVGRVPVEVSSGRAQRHLGQYSTRVPGGRSAEPHLRQ